MKYLKIGPLKIPYQIKNEEQGRYFEVSGIKIPFSTYEKDGRKCYRIFGLSFKFEKQDQLFLTQSRSNYLIKEQLDANKIEKIAKKIFKEKLGYEPDLVNPRSFNEKIFWLKLNYHNPLVTKCCDKFSVKDYVEEKLGSGYVVPTIKSWEHAEEIDFAELPKQYVLKVNWSSGYNIIVKDSTVLDQEAARKKLINWMLPEQNSYYQTFNWGYKHMKPIVYAEEYMEQFEGQLYDYKFYCCNGKVKFLFIATNREQKSTLTFDFYDRDFNKWDFTYGGRLHSEVPLEKPRFYEEMIQSAEKLAEPFPFVRVDFYETADKFYVGEMTFYSGGGILPFDPIEWDYKLGEYIELQEIN